MKISPWLLFLLVVGGAVAAYFLFPRDVHATVTAGDATITYH